MHSVVPWLAISLTTLAVVLTSGCALLTSQEDVGKAVDQARITESSAAPARWAVGADTGGVRIGWVGTFDDPALVKLVEEALLNNRNLQVAAAGEERARALAAKAGAALAPSVDLTAGAGRAGSGSSDVADSTELNIGLRVGWEVDLWGRIRAGGRAASADADAAAADYRYARESLAAGTAKAYITAVAAHLQTESSRRTVKLLEEVLRIVQVKKANGAASAQDVALARSDLARTREGSVSVEGSQRDALRALEVLLGRYPSADIEVRKALPDLPPPPAAGLPSELLERRPDIIAAERQLAAAYNRVAEAKAARLPQLSLTGNAGGASSELSDILRPDQLAWQLGASLLTPLVDGGSLKATERAATAQQKAALANYGQAVLSAFKDVESLLDQGKILSRRETELREALKGATKAFRIAKLRHKEGESELLDVLSIQQRLAATDSDLISIQRVLLEQRINLYLALGGIWTGDEVPENER